MKFLSVRSDICRQLPSDSTSRWTPLPLTMQFPLLGLARDFHPLDNAHAERTSIKGRRNVCILSVLFLCPFSYRPMPRNRTITHSDVTVPSLVRAQRNPSSLPPPDSEAGLYVQALRHTLSNFRDYLRRDGKV